MELDLRKLILILLDKWWIILLTIITASALTFGFFFFFVDPVYTSESTLYVYNSDSRPSGSLTTGDLTVARSMVSTYVVLLKSDSVLSEVAKITDFGYTPAQIRKMIKASAENNTEVMRVTVENSNPVHAQVLTNTLIEVGAEKIVNVMKAGSVEIIDSAKLPIKPSGPNILLNTLIGAMLGAMLSVMAVLLIEMFDTKIKSEEDLKELFDMPILGIIPSYTHE